MRRIWITGIILIILCIPYPVIAANINPYQKIVDIHLIYENNLVRVASSEIRYGIPPSLGIQSGTIEGILLDSENRTINEFSIRDPRVVFEDEGLIEDPGKTTGTVNGDTGNIQPVEFGLVLPYTSDFHSLDLVDTTTGASLATIDLTAAINSFAQAYPDDPDIKSIQKPAPASPIPAPWDMVAILGVALIAISGAGYIILLRRTQPIQVLIVDDEPAIVELFSLLLSRKGYVPIPAQSGLACLSILKTRKKLPGLILLDIMMFPMDGWQTLEEIKKNSSWKKIPVLMLTGKQPTPSEAKKYGLCIEDYILKPIKPQELYSAIENVLMRRKFIDREIRVAIKAGFEKDLVCEYARLRKRVEVEKKLLGILRSAYATAESVQNEMTRAIDDVSAEMKSREEKLRKLQSQLSPALAPLPR